MASAADCILRKGKIVLPMEVLTFYKKRKNLRQQEQGSAILFVLILLALLSIITADFMYRSHTNLEAAQNMRDRMRAEKLAQSGLRIGQVIVSLQEAVTQAVPKEFQGLMRQIYLPEYTSLFVQKLITAEPALSANSLIEVKIEAEDGKFPINCAGGISPTATNQQLAFYYIQGLLGAKKYDSNFGGSQNDGVSNREQLAGAILDWISLVPFTKGASNILYEVGRERYKPHAYWLDTVEELKQIKGVSDSLYREKMRAAFTPYANANKSCIVNALRASPQVLEAILVASASDPNVVNDENTAKMAELLVPLLKNIIPQLSTLVPQTTVKNCVLQNANWCNRFNATTLGGTGDKSLDTQKITQDIDRLSELICSPDLSNLLTSQMKKKGDPSFDLGESELASIHPVPLCPGVLKKYLEIPAAPSSPYYRIYSNGVIIRKEKQEVRFGLEGVFGPKVFINNPICNTHVRCNMGTWVYYRTHTG